MAVRLLHYISEWFQDSTWKKHELIEYNKLIFETFFFLWPLRKGSNIYIGSRHLLDFVSCSQLHQRGFSLPKLLWWFHSNNWSFCIIATSRIGFITEANVFLSVHSSRSGLILTGAWAVSVKYVQTSCLHHPLPCGNFPMHTMFPPSPGLRKREPVCRNNVRKAEDGENGGRNVWMKGDDSHPPRRQIV